MWAYNYLSESKLWITYYFWWMAAIWGLKFCRFSAGSLFVRWFFLPSGFPLGVAVPLHSVVINILHQRHLSNGLSLIHTITAVCLPGTSSHKFIIIGRWDVSRGVEKCRQIRRILCHIIFWKLFFHIYVIILFWSWFHLSSNSLLYWGLRLLVTRKFGSICGKDTGRTYNWSILLASSETVMSIPSLMIRSVPKYLQFGAYLAE